MNTVAEQIKSRPSEARLDFAIDGIKLLSDNDHLISMRTSAAHALTAKLVPVDQSISIPLRMGEVRYDFAHYLHEMLGPKEVLTEANFKYLMDEYLQDKVANDPSYKDLSEKQKSWAKSAIETCENIYQQAFSDLLYDLSKTTLQTPIEGMQTFCSMPKTLEEAFHCYELFCADAQYSSLLANASNEARYASFRVARAALGVSENPESTKAIASLASLLDLAA